MGQQGEKLIIGVIYNTYAESIRYIHSLAGYQENKFKLVLVDNSDKVPPSSFTELLNEKKFIKYLKPDKNLGYFQGAAFGLADYMRDSGNYPEWILVTNVDIVFNDKMFFSTLEQYEARPNLGVIAPSIISQKWKTDYNPERVTRYSLRRMKFLRFVYFNFLFSNAYTLLAYLKKALQKPAGTKPDQRIYAPHGACLVFHRNYFERGGTLEHFSFLFGEEINVAETAAALGLEILYVPGMRVLDFEHASTGWFKSPEMNRYHRKAVKEIIRKYYHNP